MPYIKTSTRDKIYPLVVKLAEGIQMEAGSTSREGMVNYAITKLLLEAFNDEKGYATYNKIMGVLTCVQQEFYRRAAAPYEDKKAKENGDVF